MALDHRHKKTYTKTISLCTLPSQSNHTLITSKLAGISLSRGVAPSLTVSQSLNISSESAELIHFKLHCLCLSVSHRRRAGRNCTTWHYMRHQTTEVTRPTLTSVHLTYVLTFKTLLLAWTIKNHTSYCILKKALNIFILATFLWCVNVGWSPLRERSRWRLLPGTAGESDKRVLTWRLVH